MKPLSSAYFTLILPIIALALLAAGCRREADPALLRADALMEQYPDSAFAILSAIDPVSLGGDKPYYALLMTQVQVKAGETVLSDSLIRIAYSHYGDHGSGDRSVRASFYVGEVAFNRGDNRTAMLYYLAALEEARNTGDSYWEGKAAQRMADLFFGACNYDEAERYHGMAAESFGMAGRTDNRRYALADLATVCLNNHKEDRAAQLLDSLYAVCASDVPADSFLLRYVRRPMIDAYLATGRLGEITEKDIEMLENPLSQSEMLDNAILFNRLKSAGFDVVTDNGIHDYMDSLGYSNETKALLLYELYRDAKSRGDDSKALAYTDTLICLQSEVTEDILKQSMTGAQRDFYNRESVRNAEKVRRSTVVVLVVVIVSVIIIVLLFLTSYFKIKATNASRDAVLATVADLNERMCVMSEDNEEFLRRMGENDIAMREMRDEADRQRIQTRHVLEELFKDKWTTLNMLCDEYFNADNTESMRKAVFSKIKSHLDNMRSKASVADILAATDMYMDGIVTKLRVQCPFLKESDILFLSLIFAGLSVRTVCMFTDISYNNYYVKKHRLSKKISESGATDRDCFIEKLNGNDRPQTGIV